MAFLGIKVPHEIARALAGIDISPQGEKVTLSTMHVTILYLGKETPVEKLLAATEAAFSVTSTFPPFQVETSLVSTFSANPDDGIPIIARIDSPALHELKDALKASFKKAGVEFPDKYPEYKPHVTLGYSQDLETEIRDKKIAPPVQWGVGEVVLWGGDKGDEKLTVTFPLSIAPTKEAKRKVFAKVATMRPVISHDENGVCQPECPCHKRTLAQRVVAKFLQRQV
jgi:2'-5' RNA ligase